MKKIRHFTAMLLSLAMCFSLAVSASAASETDLHTTADQVSVMTKINEYEALKYLAGKSSTALKSEGYSSQEIASIKAYREGYLSHIETLQNMTDEALQKNGYSAEQISIIRDFSGTDAELERLGSELTFYASPALFKYTEGGRTTGRLAYHWTWRGIPYFTYRDMVAVSWNNWYLTSDQSFVNYYNKDTGDFWRERKADLSYPSGVVKTLGAAHSFDMLAVDPTYYAKTGGGSFDVESDGLYQKDFFFYTEYAHTQSKFSFDFSIGITGGVPGSISFAIEPVEIASDEGEFKWKNSSK